jgi:hypothetical protein
MSREKPLHVEFAPGTEPEHLKPWRRRERILMGLLFAYIVFTVTVWLEVFPATGWVAAILLLAPPAIFAFWEIP